MEHQDVYDHRAKQYESERHADSDQHQQATDNLQNENDIEVAGADHGANKLGSPTLPWRQRNKVEPPVQTENNKKKSEKNPDNDDDDFHSMKMIPLAASKCESIIGRRTLTTLASSDAVMFILQKSRCPLFCPTNETCR